ncbi:MAG: aminoacyl-histidine dipeptidase [Bacteroidaceae bacterium]|nr:aminoacyl-histidine dipeptidase [Bacteroidaceae bacterium]MBQ3189529.1 aminoacyl-histidine dipeptidase [Bacteroidaceae bacterium]
MAITIKDLEPRAVWKHFEALTQVPRPSGHLQKVQQFLLDFGKSINVETWQDEAGNIIMRKPATPGLEARKGIILQAHMDMVPQKTPDSTHNFETDPIKTVVKGDWLYADNTTLGADNGLGVAAIMAIMEDDTLQHGPLEALITADEETGMYGAFGLKGGELQGNILLNLDSEEEGVMYIGCAGGLDITATMQFMEETPFDGDVAVKVQLKGLRGGHSGLEINAGRGNANKLMARFVREAMDECAVGLSSWKGGNMRNAIPASCEAVLTLPQEGVEELKQIAARYQALYNSEYATIEEGITLTVEECELPETVLPEEIQDNLIDVILACHDGVLRFIPTIPDTVETSSNLSIVSIAEGEVQINILARSSCDTMKEFLALQLSSCFAMAGMKVELSGGYSGWQPNVNSPLLAALKKAYSNMFGKEPDVRVIHAGLECGIISTNYPGMDMVSFGPTLMSPHSPGERVEIATVEKFYSLVKALVVDGVL